MIQLLVAVQPCLFDVRIFSTNLVYSNFDKIKNILDLRGTSGTLISSVIIIMNFCAR